MADATPTAAPLDSEQPTSFYLGREYDLEKKTVLPDKYIKYDAGDLTTHGVVVGMTGSGKTGLCISLLEEAAIDGIPSILIDPKGDLTNILLQFPDLDPRKFQEWIDEDDAKQKGLSPDQYAVQVANRWRKGLEETNQTPERIARLKASSDWRIYTPGSEAGLPLSILGTFAAPKGNQPQEEKAQRAEAIASALLGLTGVSADPIQSREHILISRILLDAWESGVTLDLVGLIRQIQSPRFQNVGAYSLETFFSAKERVKFASTLNNVSAAPSFGTWMKGEPLDLGVMLRKGGRPQQLIFYTAHLPDMERMFFTTLLLQEVLSWARKQGGTTNLRALLYFDEVYGYLPPTANPPSKRPLLTLLKQVRAFGVGVLLATQNPIDLDYKALSNAGTWFVGKLQTERDKARLLDGLESAAAEYGQGSNRADLDKKISALGNRIFLMHDVHRTGPAVVFQSRWALSFLRGPMTREQVSRLMEPLKNHDAPPAVIPLCAACGADLGPEVTDHCPKCGKYPWAVPQHRLEDKAFRQSLPRAASAPAAAEAEPTGERLPPVLPGDVKQFHLPSVKARPANVEVEYQPRVLGFANVVYVVDKRKGVEHTESVRLLAAPAAPGHPTEWDKAEPFTGELPESTAPEPNARWAGVPDSLDTGRKLKALEKAFADHLYTTRKLSLWENRTLGLVSRPGEGREDFRQRCRAAATEEARQALALEKAKFKPKFEALDMKLPDEKPAAKTGGSWLGWIFKAPETAESDDPRLEDKRRKVKTDYESKTAEIAERWNHVGDEATAIQVKPRKADVHVTYFGLGWAPLIGKSPAY